MADMPKMKTLTINGITFEVVDEVARSNVFVGNYDTVTFAEIKTAQDAGKVCFLNFDGTSLPLLVTNDTEAIFVREINENTDYMVTITADDEKSFTMQDKNISDVYVAGLFSAKYADAKAAYDAGKACFVTYGALLCPMTVLDEEKAEFVGMLTPHMGIKGILYAAGTYDFQYVHSNAVQTVAQTLTDAQKAQARTNIGALSAGDVDTVLQQAKDSGQFDGEDGYTPVKGKDYFDGANGKTAYAYAQDGGYTGTEAEFAAKLAESNDVVIVSITGDDTNGYASDKTVSEIQAALDDGKMILARVGNNAYAVLSYLLRDFSVVFTTYASSKGKFSAVSYTILEMFGNEVDKSIFDTDAYEMPADYVTAGTFAGQVVANANGQDAGTSLLRNSKLVSAETDPTVNGEICWTYE